MLGSEYKPNLHVEVCLRAKSIALHNVARRCVNDFLMATYPSVLLDHTLPGTDLLDQDFIKDNVEWIRICELREGTDVVQLSEVFLEIHVYQLNEEEGVDEIGEEENVSTSNNWILPARGLVGVWESLIYDDDLQIRLLDYVYTSMLFGDREVDPNLVSVNRVILLHGPPGTGKTSLCKALAQKLSVRLSERYAYGKLVEINSHSLFSKYFSESGKLVVKMFQQIHDFLEDEDAFVCILIDEVESLSTARKAALSGVEPSDAIRVVNALLTQLDQLRRRKNVLILTTSNITEAIDAAFLDRADIKQYVPLPSHRARYAILASCLNELITKKIISQTDTPLVDYREIDLALESAVTSFELWKTAKEAENMSARALRKLPFLAHAFEISISSPPSLMTFIYALRRTIRREQLSRQSTDSLSVTLGKGLDRVKIEH
ncbi:P-loop containing nucleoside triphosphate hydrolase protein [Phlyctochytrium arcticum]|nr:P-loop containing nucleoside triphosphate hydrolase protein [Phlyctochytrium arcticum]